MGTTGISGGVVHSLPADLRKALGANPKALGIWNSLTPLARNEWICRVTFFKKPETRLDHVERTITDLNRGKRRPCCWIGCTHRKDKAISPSVKRILSRRKQ